MALGVLPVVYQLVRLIMVANTVVTINGWPYGLPYTVRPQLGFNIIACTENNAMRWFPFTVCAVSGLNECMSRAGRTQTGLGKPGGVESNIAGEVMLLHGLPQRYAAQAFMCSGTGKHGYQSVIAREIGWKNALWQ